MQYTIFADGGARGNPGPAGAGAVVKNSTGENVARVSAFLGHRTNNFAEYEAVIRAFESLGNIVKEKADTVDVAVNLDSELIVKQMRGEYKVKHPVLKEQHSRLLQYIGAYKTVVFTHIPRAQNAEADTLANEAMDAGE